MFSNGANNAALRDGLSNMFVATRGNTSYQFFSHGVSRESQDRPSISARPQPFGGLNTIDQWHLDIHKYDVVIMSHGFNNGLLSVISDIDLRSGAL
jgi:hypothetical protein